jgi:regulator of sigma E protease
VIGALQTLGSFVLVLGILVFVHELGHFLVAKALGIGVKVFSLGFGPRLLGFRRGGTDYRISLIPLGGYVRLQGDEADDERNGAPEEFLGRPKWQRFLVYVAGAAFNIVLAVLLTWFVLWQWGEPIVDSYPVVSQIAPGSNAERAGVQVGDRILEIAGQDALDENVELVEIYMSPDAVRTLVLERDGARVTAELETGSDATYRMGQPGWRLVRGPVEPPLVVGIVDGERASEAGLAIGDEVLSADDEESIDEIRLRALLAASPERDVRMRVRRDGETLSIVVRPADLEGKGRIGAVFYTRAARRDLGGLEALRSSLRRNWRYSGVLFTTLGKYFTRQISARAFSGPIEIAQFSRRAVMDMETFLSFLAFISLQLGILNLLPIPVLDGGHILILGVEGVMRRDLSDRVKERLLQAGLLLLLGFFGYIFFLDLDKIRAFEFLKNLF